MLLRLAGSAGSRLFVASAVTLSMAGCEGNQRESKSPAPRAAAVSAAEKMATLDGGRPPTAGAVVAWDRRLDRVRGKCGEASRDRVAEILFKGHKELTQRGTHARTLSEFAWMVDASLAPGRLALIPCADAVTSVVVRDVQGMPPLAKDDTAIR